LEAAFTAKNQPELDKQILDVMRQKWKNMADF